MDPVTHSEISAKAVNFSTERGKSLMHSNWECRSGESVWTFDFNTCQWETVQGTKSLVEVRNVHNKNIEGTAQSFLGV